jgi:hypothetical protein
MDKNLSWTSSLGDAYYNQQPDVMDAVQTMRRRAQQTGNLKSGLEQTVTTQGSTIVIEPAEPQVVYVPAYDPWVVYGDPIVAWPGWYAYPGIWWEGPGFAWGLGFEIGWFGGFGWGWGHWGFDWGHRYAEYDHRRYDSGSRTFYNRNSFYRGGGESSRAARGEGFDHPGPAARPFNGDHQAARGYAEPRGQSGVRSGAFSDFGHGAEERGFSSRGSSSFGGGGFDGARGGGGFGGGHGGGGRR